MSTFFRKLRALLLARLERWGLKRRSVREQGRSALESIIMSDAISAARRSEPIVQPSAKEEPETLDVPVGQPAADVPDADEHPLGETEVTAFGGEHQQHDPEPALTEKPDGPEQDADSEKVGEIESEAVVPNTSPGSDSVEEESRHDRPADAEGFVEAETMASTTQPPAMERDNEASADPLDSIGHVEPERAEPRSERQEPDSEFVGLERNDAAATSIEDHSEGLGASPAGFTQLGEAVIEPDEEPSPSEAAVETPDSRDVHADEDSFEQKPPHTDESEHPLSNASSPVEASAPDVPSDAPSADLKSAAMPSRSTADILPPPVAGHSANLPTPPEWESFSERAQTQPIRPRESSTIEATTTADEEDEDNSPTSNHAAAPARSQVRKRQEPIDFSECPLAAGVTDPLPENYLYWNRLLAARFLNAVAGSKIHLAVSPRFLATVLLDNEGERVHPSAAEERFIQAVRDAYHYVALASSSGLRIFRRRATGTGLPLCIGFLALSVLAAHKMHSDEANSSSAYYIRLSDLLAAAQRGSDHPAGFQKLEFEALWNFLAEWVSKHSSSSLALPDADVEKRYISYPLGHVPLRQLDLEKLPTFFNWADYSSGSLISPERIADDFRRWAGSYSILSQAGRDALGDSRSPAVLAQIRSELRSWDGSVVDAQGSRYVQVEVLLENVKRRSLISLLAPRREGCPEVFRCGDVEIIGGNDWFDPLELVPADGRLLEQGFTWPADGSPNWVFRRPPAEIIVLAPNAEYSGLVTRTQIPKDVCCAVLCHERVAERVINYLKEICDVAPRAIVEGNCPADWRLFLRVRVIRAPENVPRDLQMLDPATETELVPQGGLRLGRWSWMQGAAPRLLVEGREGRTVYVNDSAVDVDEEGYLRAEQILSQAGTYAVRVGFIERTIRIVPPMLRRLAGETMNAESRASWPVVLDPGRWTLIGRRLADAQHAVNPFNRPSLLQSAFEPVWAIKVNVGRGARVIHLSAAPADDGVVTTRAQAQLWVSSIYEAAIRHAQIESKLADGGDARSRAWAEYVAVARALKRQWKKGH